MLENVDITGVTSDSRKVRSGFLFVCVNGTKTDGHEFARIAVELGAAVVLAACDTGVKNQIITPDTRKAYAMSCAAFFGNPAKALTLVGITGTKGKTTTSTLIKNILEAAGYKTGLIGTISKIVGEEETPSKNTTPDAYELHETLRNMVEAGCTHCVMEVSSHALEQDRVYGLEFAVGVFTNLTHDHLDYHKTQENYRLQKSKLFSQTKQAVINIDDSEAWFMLSVCKCPVTTLSLKDESADYLAKNIRFRPTGVDFELLGVSVIGRVKFQTPGEFSVYNALTAGVCSLQLGVPFNTVIEALSQATGVKGRVELVPTGRDFTVIIDYAHNPESLQNVLSALNKYKTGRLITLFGCGGDRDRGKRPQMGKIAADHSDFVIVTSDNPRTEEPRVIIDDILVGMEGTKTPFEVVENRVEAIQYAIKNARPEDMILLAGKGHETYQEVNGIRNHMDEREIVANALRTLAVES
jgi:UDP-N-acetylmuramoyl-L-alanyl-D-glutamate--2,6-diaminopimelate ligase